jgi:hypothetical protein
MKQLSQQPPSTKLKLSPTLQPESYGDLLSALPLAQKAHVSASLMLFLSTHTATANHGREQNEPTILHRLWVALFVGCMAVLTIITHLNLPQTCSVSPPHFQY